MPFFCIFGCNNPGVALHVFPNPEKDPERYKVWASTVGEKLETLTPFEVYKKKRICDIHFLPKHKNRNNRLSTLAVPSLHLSGSTGSGSNNVQSTIDRDNHHIALSAPAISTKPADKIVKNKNSVMALKRVLIVNKMFPAAGIELLRAELEPTVLPIMDYEPDSLSKIRSEITSGYDGLIWNTKHRLTGEILDLAGPRLEAVTATASGIDHIDTDELKRRGLPLGNTPKVLDDAVADIAVGLMIGAARRFKEGIKEIESGELKYGVQWRLGQDIANSTVGVVGLGGIGMAVVRRLTGFNVAKFLYSGRTDKREASSLKATRVPLEILLKEGDFVILCCPLTVETKHLINANTLQLMKKTSVLVNIGRGGLIDQTALLEALQSGRIFAAGLDVTTPEPIPKDNPLVSLPNCYIMPHLGSATVETRNSMARISATNILSALKGKTMACPIVL